MYLRDTLRLPAKRLSPSALPIFHQPARWPSLSRVCLRWSAPNEKTPTAAGWGFGARVFYVRPYASGHQTSPGNAGARKPVKVVARKGQMPALHDTQCYTLWLVMSITTECSAGHLGANPNSIILAEQGAEKLFRPSPSTTLRGDSLAPLRERKGEKLYLRDTLRLPAKGLSPSALPIFVQLFRDGHASLSLEHLRQEPHGV